MPRIRCHYSDCVFVDDGYCSAAAVELDPDTGCATYSPNEESASDEWEEEEELDEWEDEGFGDEDDDAWDEDEEAY